MNYRTLTVAVALIAVRLVVSAEPKAADTVFYKGKAPGLRIPLSSTTATWRPAISRSPNLRAGKQRGFYLSGRDGQMGTGQDAICSGKGRKKRGFVRGGSAWQSSVPYQGHLYGRRKNCSVHSYKKEEALNRSKCRFKFNKCGQLFIGTYNEALSVAVSLPAKMTSRDTLAKCVRAKITAIRCAKRRSRSHDVVIRDCDDSGNAIGNVGSTGANLLSCKCWAVYRSPQSPERWWICNTVVMFYLVPQLSNPGGSIFGNV